MATLTAQIESYIGSVTAESSQLPVLISHSANWIIDIAPLPTFDEQGVETAVTSGGLDINSARVLWVKSATSGKRCRKIAPNEITDATSSSSLKQATAYDPVFYVYGDKLYISEGSTPTSGTAYIISHILDSAITPGTDTAITGLPIHLLPLAIIGTAIRILMLRLQTKITAIGAVTPPSLTITASAPTALSAPSFADVAGEFSNYVAITAPTALSLSAQYTELDTDLDTEEDVELAMAKIEELKTRIAEWNTVYTEALNRLAKDKDNIRANGMAFYEAEHRQQIAEYDATVKRFAQELGKYQSDIQRGLETYRADISKYAATIEQEKAEYESNLRQLAHLRQLYNDIAFTTLGTQLQPPPEER